MYADRTLFLSESGDRISYYDVIALSETSAFRETQLSLVFCICANDLGGLAGYLALLRAGAVPLMISDTLPAPQLARLIEIYKPQHFWLPEIRQHELPNAILEHRYGSYELRSEPCALDYPIHGDLALLLSTSGSTGSPKFVRLSNKNVLSNAEAIANFLELKDDDRPITTLPPSYTYGLSIIHSHIVRGATIALTRRTFLDRGFWSFFESVQATSLGGVPYHYELLDKLRFHRMSLPSLRLLTQAGGRMSPEMSLQFAMQSQARGVRFVTMYGQVEATARMAYLRVDSAITKAGSIGRAIPGGELSLIDEQGQPIVQSGVVGQLIYRGPNVFWGYAFNYSDLKRGDEIGGELKTGDLAKFDADGDFFVVGRLKRFIKMFGHSVHLQDFEEELSDAGYTVACTGADDQLDVYVCDPSAGAVDAIMALLVGQFKITPTSIRVFSVKELPRNESGKIQYAELEKLHRTENK